MVAAYMQTVDRCLKMVTLVWKPPVIRSAFSKWIRYDTIRYVYEHSKADWNQLNLAHGTKNKNKEFTKNKNWVAQKKRSGL